MLPFLNGNKICVWKIQCGNVVGWGVWVWACFTARQENQDILSGQTQHSRELIEHDWVRMCGRHVKQTAKI